VIKKDQILHGVLYWVRYGKRWRLMEGEHLRIHGQLHRRLRSVTNVPAERSAVSVKDYKIGSRLEPAGETLEPSDELRLHYGQARKRRRD